MPVGRYVWNAVSKLDEAINDIYKYACTLYIDVWEIVGGDFQESHSIHIHDTPETIHLPIPPQAYQFNTWISKATPIGIVANHTQPSMICQKRLRARKNFKDWLESLNSIFTITEFSPGVEDLLKTTVKQYRRSIIDAEDFRSLDDYVTVCEFLPRLYAVRDEVKITVDNLKQNKLPEGATEDQAAIFNDFRQMLDNVSQALESAWAKDQELQSKQTEELADVH